MSPAPQRTVRLPYPVRHQHRRLPLAVLRSRRRARHPPPQDVLLPQGTGPPVRHPRPPCARLPAKPHLLHARLEARGTRAGPAGGQAHGRLSREPRRGRAVQGVLEGHDGEVYPYGACERRLRCGTRERSAVPVCMKWQSSFDGSEQTRCCARSENERSRGALRLPRQHDATDVRRLSFHSQLRLRSEASLDDPENVLVLLQFAIWTALRALAPAAASLRVPILIPAVCGCCPCRHSPNTTCSPPN